MTYRSPVRLARIDDVSSREKQFHKKVFEHDAVGSDSVTEVG